MNTGTEVSLRVLGEILMPAGFFVICAQVFGAKMNKPSDNAVKNLTIGVKTIMIIYVFLGKVIERL